MGCKRGFILMSRSRTAPHAAAANVSHPTKQGLVQSFSVYIDTLWYVQLLGLCLLIRKIQCSESRFGADGAIRFLYQGAENVTVGPGFTKCNG
jgi:AGCS family alanine or glycine:cation symporter